MEWTFPTDRPLMADLELAAGSVELELAPTDEARVRLEPLERDSAAALDHIARTTVSCEAGRLVVRPPKHVMHEPELLLQVLVPSSSSARVKTASADVSCVGPLGLLEAKTASGDVVVRDGCDSAKVQTASGDVSLAEVLGQAEVQTASGDVSTESIGGRATVTTASGDIRVASVAHDARLRTASGEVTVGCAYEGDLSINGVSGDVRVGVGAGVGTWLDLMSVTGDWKCTLPAEPESERGAALRVSCRTVSGDIYVHAGEPVAG